LFQDRRRLRRRERHRLPQVILDELAGGRFRDHGQDHAEVPEFLGPICQGQEQRELVRSHEEPFIHEPLKVHQELDLLFGGGDIAYFLPVRGVVLDHPADARARVGNVALTARDDVDVRVIDRLARCQPVVKADIKAVRFQTGEQALAHVAYEVPDCSLLRHRQF
jgi:hypothetical protein